MPAPHRFGWLNTLGWACYLACSWTWCIGMFLPVLLVRDYGPWGFVVFAVPNVVGAAAMGWVLRRPGAADSLLVANWLAVQYFSLVTLSFQIVWLTWAFGVGGWRLTVGLLAGAAACWLFVTMFQRRASELCGAVATLGASITAAAILVTARAGESSPFDVPSSIAPGVPYVTAACVFGFVLCPYLDVTFLRARATVRGHRGTAAFLVGFIAIFLPLIVLTMLYADIMPTRRLRLLGDFGRWPIVIALGLHFFAQILFTVVVHLRALKWAYTGPLGQTVTSPSPEVQVSASRLKRLANWLLLALVIFMYFGPDYADLSAGEIVYRLFMSFYGLVFPVYVWLCMIPTRTGHSGIDGPVGRRKLIVWAATVALAAPAFWMGFIEREEWWLGPGLAIVLLARLLIPGGWGFGRLPPEPSGAPVPAPTHPPTLAAHATPGPHPGDA